MKTPVVAANEPQNAECNQDFGFAKVSLSVRECASSGHRGEKNCGHDAAVVGSFSTIQSPRWAKAALLPACMELAIESRLDRFAPSSSAAREATPWRLESKPGPRSGCPGQDHDQIAEPIAR